MPIPEEPVQAPECFAPHSGTRRSYSTSLTAGVTIAGGSLFVRARAFAGPLIISGIDPLWDFLFFIRLWGCFSDIRTMRKFGLSIKQHILTYS